MKTLADNAQVSAFSYYFLLEWNEKDKKKTIQDEFGTNQLCALNIEQYASLFDIASQSELNNLKNKIK